QPAEKQIIVRHFIHNTQGVGVQLTQAAEVPLRQLLGGRRGEVREALDRGETEVEYPRQRLEGVVSVAQFAGSVDLRVARQNLLGERRAGTRQPNDEDRHLGVESEAAHSCEELWAKSCDHTIDKACIRRRVVGQPLLLPQLQAQ